MAFWSTSEDIERRRRYVSVDKYVLFNYLLDLLPSHLECWLSDFDYSQEIHIEAKARLRRDEKIIKEEIKNLFYKSPLPNLLDADIDHFVSFIHRHSQPRAIYSICELKERFPDKTRKDIIEATERVLDSDLYSNGTLYKFLLSKFSNPLSSQDYFSIVQWQKVVSYELYNNGISSRKNKP